MSLTTTEASSPDKPATGQSVVFTGHNAYLMSVARVCREANKFTDVTLVCPDGEVVGHRLILAAASSTLRSAFHQVAGDEATADYTIIVPDVKKAIVASLVDFLYTGKLIISRSNSRDMQLLVRMLGIDPDNVRVEALEESTKKRMVQSQLTASMGLMTHKHEQKEQNKASQGVQQTPPLGKTKTSTEQLLVNGDCHSSSKKSIEEVKGTPSSEPSGKTLPSRAAKRRASQENGLSPVPTKEQKLSSTSSQNTPSTAPLAPIGSGFGGNGRRKPSRPPQPPKKQQSKSAKAAAAATAAAATAAEEAPGLLSGYHDMSNVETWVCAICHLYDPATDEPGGGDDGSGDTTEWIGCDCNRWYHKLCTGLAVVDETFCCAQVKLSCLPPSPAKK